MFVILSGNFRYWLKVSRSGSSAPSTPGSGVKGGKSITCAEDDIGPEFESSVLDLSYRLTAEIGSRGWPSQE